MTLPALSPALVLLLNAVATLFMTGLIWFVQIVHYPLFGSVGAEGFDRYAALHTRRTTWVVGPPMLLELATSFGLVFRLPVGNSSIQAWSGLALVGVIWLSTLALQIPRHNVLGSGYDPAAHRALVTTNWLRTIAWSGRAALVLWMLAQMLKV